MTTEPELLEAILANRGDRDAYRVYGDWLQSQGDPRGELVAMQLRADEGNLEDGAVLLAIKNHLARYKSLVPPLDQWQARFRWKWGFIVGAELDDPSPEQLVSVLEHGSCRALESLRVENHGDDAPSVLDRLEQSRPTIERLQIISTSRSEEPVADRFWDRVPHVGTLLVEGDTLFRSVRSSLKVLALEGLPFPIEAWDLPVVESIRWTRPSREALQPLWLSALPSLHTLSLFDVDSPALFESEGFMARVAKLEHLVVPKYAVADNTPELIRTLLDHASQLTHLKSLGLTGRLDDEEDAEFDWSEVRYQLPIHDGYFGDD